jgi:hypothetical protein
MKFKDVTTETKAAIKALTINDLDYRIGEAASAAFKLKIRKKA